MNYGTAYKSFRIVFHQAQGSALGNASYVVVTEWAIYEDEDGATPSILTASGAIISASDSNGSNTPPNAVDGSNSSHWQASSAAGEKWIRCDIPEPKVPRRMMLRSHTSNSYVPRVLTLQGSNDDGFTWAPIAKFNQFLTAAGEKTVILTRRFGGKALLSDGQPASKISILGWNNLEKVVDIVPEADGSWEFVVGEKKDYLCLFFGPVGYRPIAEGPVSAPNIEV